MVAMVSGSGLGLSNSSLALLGARGGSGVDGFGQRGDRIYLNSATGNLVIQGRDELLTSIGRDLAVVRTYNSQGLLDDDNGDNWTVGGSRRLYGLTGQINTLGSTIIKVFGDGAELVYTYDGSSGRYLSSDGGGAHDTLSYDAGPGQWTWLDGSERVIEVFDTGGRLLVVSDADGHVQTYSYTGALLTAITGSSGDVTTLEYDGTNLKALHTTVDGLEQTLTRYEYDTLDRLERVIVDLTPESNDIDDGLTFSTTFTYDDKSLRVASITNSDGTTISFTYELLRGLHRVKTYTDGEGNVTTLTYDNFLDPATTLAARPSALSTAPAHVLNEAALTAVPAGWESASLRESHTAHASLPQFAYDAAGNGLLIYRVDGDIKAQRYIRATNSWSAEVTLDSRTNAPGATSLAVDARTGNAVAAWVQSDGAAESVWAARFDAASGTWGAATLIDSGTLPVNTAAGTLVTAINGQQAAVAWQHNVARTGSTYDLYVARFNGQSWAAPELVEASASSASQQSLSMDELGNITIAFMHSDGANNSIYTNRYSMSAGAWSGASIREVHVGHAALPQFAYDAAGNGLLIYRVDGDIKAQRYTHSTNSWSAEVTLDSRNNSTSTTSLAVDAQTGNAVAAWVQSDGAAESVWAARFDAASGLWNAATLVESRARPANTTAGTLVTAISGQRAAVAWQHNVAQSGSTYDLYVARFDGQAWVEPELAESSTNSASQQSLTIDALGNVTIAFMQSNGSNNSIYTNRYVAAQTRSYTVPPGATWESIAMALYGTNQASDISALQAAMGNPPLTAGSLLYGWPPSLPITVPAYYKVNEAVVTGVPPGWQTASLREAHTTHASLPQFAYDASGNGLLIYRLDGDIKAQRYTRATNSWSAEVTLDSRTNSIGATSLSVDALTGNAVAAWVQSDGAAESVWAARFDAASGIWSAATLLESITRSVNTVAGTLVTAINGQRAAVSWQHNAAQSGTTYDLYVAQFDGHAWGAAGLVEAGANNASQQSLAMDALGNITIAFMQSNGASNSIYTNRYTASSGAWSGASLRESHTTHASLPQFAYDSIGNGLLIYRIDGDIKVQRYLFATDSWSAEVTLDSNNNVPAATSLVVDSRTGDAVAAWVQSDGAAESVWAARFDGASGTWGAATLIESMARPVNVVAGTLVTAINAQGAAVAWQHNAAQSGSTYDLYVARFTGQGWTAPELVEAGTSNASQQSLAMDDQGSLTIAFMQSDGSSNSIYTNRYVPARSWSYTVPAGATWESIAAVLYGTTKASDVIALRAALGNPPLTPGSQLHGLPDKLLATVPAYYTVRSNDTWASITQVIYGTASTAAVAALRARLGDPSLTARLRLNVPLTLTFEDSSDAPSIAGQVDITDALGHVTTFLNDAQGRLTSLLTAAVGGQRLETRYAYDAAGNLASITEDPAGRNLETVFKYDSRGNMISSRDVRGRTTTRTYSATNQVLTESLYTSAGPDFENFDYIQGALTTRYTYGDKDRLRFVVSPEGRITEHRYDADGNRRATLVYAGRELDLSGLAWNESITESELASWTAAQDLMQVERTDYDYDFRGNPSSITTYRATDASGQGIASGASVTRFVYDQRGQLLQRIDPRGEATADPKDYVTTYTYDGLGRLLTSVRWSSDGLITTEKNIYADGLRQAVVVSAEGLETTTTFDRTGRAVSVQTSSGGVLATTEYIYDQAGRLTMTRDPVGVRSYVVYDEVGRIAFTVDGDGSVSERIYDVLGNLVVTVDYTMRIQVSGSPLTLDRVRLQLNPERGQDRVTRYAYDETNRELLRVDSYGSARESKYDAAGRKLKVTEFATRAQLPEHRLPMSLDELYSLVRGDVHDRVTHYIYDNDGRLAGTLDAEGYLTESVYDAAGRLIKTIAYANPTTVAGHTLESIRPAQDDEIVIDPERDAVTWYFYDGAGRRVGQLDAESYLTEWKYDAAGHVLEQIRYPGTVTYSGTPTLAAVRPATSAGAHIVSYQYDEQGRVTLETNHEATATQYVYDREGRLIRTARALDTVEERVSQTRYDQLGRVIAELTPEGSTQITPGVTSAEIDTIWSLYGVRYEYDDAGRRISSTDQYGNVTLYFYGEDHQLRFVVNDLGEVVETVYNSFNEVFVRIAYAGRISTTGLSGGAIPNTLLTRVAAVANPAKDSRTVYRYSTGGQVVEETTAEGGLITRSYNAFKQLASSTQLVDITSSQHSREKVLTYDRRGLLITTRVDPAGLNLTETNQYDAFGQLTSVTDARGNVRQMRYDRLGRVVTTIDQLGASAVTSYDAFSRMLTSTDRMGRITTYAYDDTTRSVVVTTPEGLQLTTARNRHGQIASVTDARGVTTSHEYDSNGQLERRYDSLGTLEEQLYDRAGRLTHSIDANGVVTRIEYDHASRVFTRTVDPDGLALVTTYEYDGRGRTVSVTDERGVVTETRYDFDNHGELTTVIVDPNGLNLRTTYSYNRGGLLRVTTEGAGSANPRTTLYSYDVAGRRIREAVVQGATLPDAVTLYRHDRNGNVTRRIDPRGHSTWYIYDDAGRMAYAVDALGGVTRTDYDSEGRVTRTRRYALAIEPQVLSGWGDEVTLDQIGSPATSSHDRIEEQVYDRDGRAIYLLQTLGTNGAAVVTARTYDGNGNVVSRRTYANTIDASVPRTIAEIESALLPDASRDRQAFTAYDIRGHATFDIDEIGAVTRMEYDAAGHVIAHTAFASTRNTTSAPSHDTMVTWATKKEDAADRTTRYWYDAAGRQVFQLDAAGYVTETRWIDGEAFRSVETHGYAVALSGIDADSSLLEVQKAVDLVADPDDRSTRTWYDAADREVFKVDGQGYATETRRNDNTRSVETFAYASAPSVGPDATLDDVRNAVQGIAGNRDRYTKTDYDAVGRVSKVTDAYGNSEEFGYDAAGNRTSYRNQRGNVWTYFYDANNRLTEEHSPSVSISIITAVGNGLSKSSTTAVLVTRTQYNTFGDVSSRTEAYGRNEARTTTYEYDRLGRQIRVIYPNASVYDPAADDETLTGLSVVRKERIVTPETLVTYNALGDAVVNRDVAGNYQHLVYDRAGRVKYRIDTENYVTEHVYDAFGDEIEQIRYATALDVSTLVLSDEWTAEKVAEDLQESMERDRRVVTLHDRLGRATEIISPEVHVYLPNTGASSGGVSSNANGRTLFEYNAFGEVIRRRQLVNPSTSYYAVDHFYYDRRGLRTDSIDALGYLTHTDYDARGNIVRTVEYSRAIAVPPLVPGGPFNPPPVTTPSSSPNHAAGYDRETTYDYDRLDRLVTETQINVQYTAISNSNNTVSTTGNIATNYAYDAAGNRTVITDATGAQTFTYFDVLGRAIATAAPRRDVDGGTTTTNLTPLTEMAYDVFGNMVEQKQYANGAATANATVYTTGAPDITRDRITRILLDAHGRALRTVTGGVAVRDASYNERGELAKEWQHVQDVEGDTETLVTIYGYDRLGRTIKVTQPARLDGVITQVVTTEAQYNAFGEVVSKGIGGGEQEYFEYDRAGRLWRTNGTDGVDKVHLYDLLGNMTAEIRSQTRNLRTDPGVTSPAEALALSGSDQMRTETRYDLLGRAVERREAAFTIRTPAIDATFQFAMRDVPTPPHAIWRRVEVGDGQFEYRIDPSPWNLGGGYYQVSPPSASNPDGTYARVPQNQYSLQQLSQIYWDRPSESLTKTFQYRVTGGSWMNLDVNGISYDHVAVSTAGIGNGTYEYRVTYERAGDLQQPLASATGTFTIAGGVVTALTDTTATSVATSATPRVQQTYDRWGQVLSVTDAASNTTHYRYDQRGNLIEIQLPTQLQGDTLLSTIGGTVTYPTARPLQRNYYDLLGRLVATRDGNGNLNTMAYNAGSQQVSERHADGGGKQFVYDAFGQQVQVTEQAEASVSYRSRMVYDRLGNVITLAREVTRGGFLSSVPSSLVGVTSNDVIRTDYAYDAAGRRISETTGEMMDNLIDPEMTRYWYDLRGNVIKRRTPRGRDTSYEYDAQGRKTLERNPLGDELLWSHDYFGRLQTHADLGGAVSTYDYDSESGLLASMSSQINGQAAHSIIYQYDAAAHLTGITENGVANGDLAAIDRSTTYLYDSAGRRSGEQVTIDGRLHQDTRVGYDSAGRMSRLSDLQYRTRYYYDAGGNRTRIHSAYFDHSGTEQDDDLWYTFDAMNRVDISQGVNNSGTIGISTTQGIDLSHDWRGQRTSARSYGKELRYTHELISTDPNNPNIIDYYREMDGYDTEQYEYDGLGRLIQIDRRVVDEWIGFNNPPLPPTASFMRTGARDYDKASRQTWSYAFTTISRRPVQNENKIERTTTTKYDDDGRIANQTTLKRVGLSDVAESYTVYGDAVYQPPGEHWYTDPFTGELKLETWDGSWTPGYDVAGNLRGYIVKVFDTATADPNDLVYGSRYRMEYRAGESYQEIEQSVGSSNGTSGRTQRTYNVNGELVSILDTQDQAKNRYFANDASGRALTVVQGQFDGQSGRWTADEAFESAIRKGHSYNFTKAQNYYFALGQWVGSFGQSGTGSTPKAHFDVNYAPISAHYPQPTAGEIVVQQGDTLRSIAARVFGDQSLWYLIAEENALTDPDTILVAGTALRIPNEVIPLNNNSSSFRPFNLSEAIGNTSPTQAGPPAPANAREGCGIVGQVILIAVAVAVSALSYGALAPYAGPLIAGAVAGAAGNLASQGVGNAIGQQQGISWSSVGTSALSGFVGGAVGQAVPVQGLAEETATALQQSVGAMAGNAVTQGIGIATGVQGRFDWRGVAAAGVTSLLTDSIRQRVGAAVTPGGAAAYKNNVALRNYTPGQFAADGAATLAGSTVRFAIGEKVTASSIVADIFGNALGNSLAAAVLSRPSEIQQQAAAPVERNQEAVAPVTDSPEQELEWQPTQFSKNYRRLEKKLDSLNLGFELHPDASNEPSSYTVQSGDSLYEIAEILLGDGNLWPALARANGIRNPALIKPGQVLEVPIEFDAGVEQKIAGRYYQLLAAANAAAQAELEQAAYPLDPQTGLPAGPTIENALALGLIGPGVITPGPMYQMQLRFQPSPFMTTMAAGAEYGLDLTERFAYGFGNAALSLVTQPFAHVADLLQIPFQMFDDWVLDNRFEPVWLSDIAKYEYSGQATTEGRILNGVGAIPVLGVGASSYQATKAVMNEDYGGLAEQSGGMLFSFLAGKAIDAHGNRRLQSPVYLDAADAAVLRVRSPLGPDPASVVAWMDKTLAAEANLLIEAGDVGGVALARAAFANDGIISPSFKNFFQDKDVIAGVEWVEAPKVSQNLFKITDTEAYIKALASRYDADSNPLNSVIEARIRSRINSDGTTMGKGLPGSHAEVQAANWAYNQKLKLDGFVDESLLTVLTYRLVDGDNRGKWFIACPNCSNILPLAHIPSGRSQQTLIWPPGVVPSGDGQ